MKTLYFLSIVALFAFVGTVKTNAATTCAASCEKVYVSQDDDKDCSDKKENKGCCDKKKEKKCD